MSQRPLKTPAKGPGIFAPKFDKPLPNAWSDWKKANVPISEKALEHTIRPCWFNNRLFVIWAEVEFQDSDAIISPTEGKADTTVKVYPRFRLYASYKKYDDSWSTPRIYIENYCQTADLVKKTMEEIERETQTIAVYDHSTSPESMFIALYSCYQSHVSDPPNTGANDTYDFLRTVRIDKNFNVTSLFPAEGFVPPPSSAGAMALTSEDEAKSKGHVQLIGFIFANANRNAGRLQYWLPSGTPVFGDVAHTNPTVEKITWDFDGWQSRIKTSAKDVDLVYNRTQSNVELTVRLSQGFPENRTLKLSVYDAIDQTKVLIKVTLVFSVSDPHRDWFELIDGSIIEPVDTDYMDVIDALYCFKGKPDVLRSLITDLDQHTQFSVPAIKKGQSASLKGKWAHRAILSELESGEVIFSTFWRYLDRVTEMPLRSDAVHEFSGPYGYQLVVLQTPIVLSATDAATQKTLLQLCAGLGLQPTEESLLLIARQTQTHLKTLKRDLPTVSSIYRQARIAQLFGLSVAELLTLAVLLGGLGYKSLLASGQLNPPTQPEVPEIPATPETPAIPATPEIPHVVDLLDVLMQLDWAVDWLKDSQQTVTLLQQRLGPNAPLKATADIDGAPSTATYEYPPLSDELLTRLSKLHDDTDRSLVTEKQLAALGLPTADLSDTPLLWFEILNADLIDDNGLLLGLDEALTRVDEAPVWIREKVKSLLEPMNLTPAVKDVCEEKLVGLLLVAHDTQAQVVEGLFQETAKLSPELTAAVVHWTGSSFYSLLLDALDKEDGSALIDQFQRVLQHAEIVINLRLSNSALRLFLINPQWLGADQYPESYGEPSFADLYLFERFSHWLHAQSQPEDTLLSYFSLANPIPSKLKNKALRKEANETANSALALLLEWPEEEIAVLTKTLPDERARSMAQVDWIRRCQATCRASGLSAKALLQATELNEQSTWEAWKAVGDAVMASHPGADSLPVNG